LLKGEISNQTFEEWNRETGAAKLPERVKARKARAKTGRPAAAKSKRKSKASTKTKAKRKSGRSALRKPK
jgi:hypothetical protein